MAQGAAHADFPLVGRFDCDITAAIETGEQVTVIPSGGRVVVRGS